MTEPPELVFARIVEQTEDAHCDGQKVNADEPEHHLDARGHEKHGYVFGMYHFVSGGA